jgi:ribosome-associated heat shock protein Hsp15
MSGESSVRIDKFLWAVRIYKTRSIATEECRKGKISINGIPVKPSRSVIRNEIILIRKLPIVYSYRVIEPIENRVPAKLVESYIEDITPDEEKKKLELRQFNISGHRARGTGRPTKKERRNLDRLRMDLNDW